MANVTTSLEGEQCQYHVQDCYKHETDHPFIDVSSAISTLYISWKNLKISVAYVVKFWSYLLTFVQGMVTPTNHMLFMMNYNNS